MDPIKLPSNKISMPFHVPFVRNSSFRGYTKSLASTDSFQELGWISNKVPLNLLDAINNLSNIQDLPDGKVIVLTLFYTSYQHLHISLAQNSIWQFRKIPKQCLIKYQVAFCTFRLLPNIYNHFKADKPILNV